ncbi:hypothetical protein AB6N23_01965 [Cellulomonas sp. 179-A 9B4 NHS]|uniref:hypothetical protein n=1 Tax=Cellulomonas sp. 179-A 9B4 NHS TaxID=3142379 RepID=UPI00399FAA35
MSESPVEQRLDEHLAATADTPADRPAVTVDVVRTTRRVPLDLSGHDDSEASS